MHLNPHKSLRIALALVGSLVVHSFATAESTKIDRPNVILFMADDMGMGDTSAYQDFTGNTDDEQLSTPAMERLARMGIRFTDAHTPSSRCTATRYGLLTGRSPWRTRLKHFVLFGLQGDPLIETDRPTLGTLFQNDGYGTAITGKWHVGLLYRNANGENADDWSDADMTKPLADCPLDHGFDFSRITSRSHGTSGPPDGSKPSGGPGHLHGRYSVTASGPNVFHREGKDAYVLSELGGRHSDDAIEYLSSHLKDGENADKPFFLYYPSNSNHSPYTPDSEIDGVPVQGASHTKSGKPGNIRLDFVYENDVALGRLIDWLEANDDPRHPGKKLIDTTIVIFTSDNGAEANKKTFTGPFRSNKASCYEGGHRVPLIVAWGAGGIGDGDASTPGKSNPTPVSLTDFYATFAELLHSPLPNLAAGEKGAEDSISMLSFWRGETSDRSKVPMFVNDHKQAGNYVKSMGAKDPAALSMRLDNPFVGGKRFPGQWKVIFDGSLIRQETAHPSELFELSTDLKEEDNRIDDPDLKPLVEHLSHVALLYRNSGGLRLAPFAGSSETRFDFTSKMPTGSDLEVAENGISVQVETPGQHPLTSSDQGIGVMGKKSPQVNDGEHIEITFDHDVIVESIELVAGKTGRCGGFFTVDSAAPLPIYCVDAHAEKYTNTDHSGVLADIGVVKEGQTLRIDSGSHYGANEPGSWTLKSITVRPVKE